MLPDTRFRINAPDVIDESVDGEVLIVHLGTGAYYSADGLGEVIWRRIVAGNSPAAVSAAIRDNAGGIEFDGAFETFVAQLLEDGLLAEDAGAPEPAVEIPSPLPVSGLVLNKYTDMEALLLLDPVHEVDPTGWPKAIEPDDIGTALRGGDPTPQ